MRDRKPKLPVQQFMILAICRFAEPVAFTSVFPYLPEMVRTLGVPNNDVARWVGIISAVFSISQCLTAVPWGSYSDRVGRKFVILFCLSLVMIFTLAFGFSQSLWMAILTRACLGLGNGNVGVIRTMVAELVPEKELQPRAFSIMPLVWTIGSIFGPAVGGSLANPAKNYPRVFGNSEFFKKFPYALPNIAVAILFVIGVLTGCLFLRETLETKKDSRDYGLVVGQLLTRPCFGQRKETGNASYFKSHNERTPLLHGNESNQDPESNTNNDKLAKPEESKPTWSQILTPQANLILLANALLGLQTLAFDAMFPVFLNYPTQSSEDNPEVNLPFKFSHGLGMDAQAIGIIYTFNGIIGMFVQFLVFPYTCNRFGVLNCLKAASILFPLVYILIPFTALFPTESSRQASAFILLVMRLVGAVYAFPCLIILLTNTAPNLRVLGTLNGVATSTAALGRSAGPALVGSVFSYGLKKGYMVIPWTVLSFLCVLSALPLFWVTEPKGFAHSADEDEEDGDDSDDGEGGEGGAEVWDEGYESDSEHTVHNRSSPHCKSNRAGANQLPSQSFRDDDTDTQSVLSTSVSAVSRTDENAVPTVDTPRQMLSVKFT